MPVTVDLQELVHGDTWQGITSIGPITVNGSPPDNACAKVLMGFGKAETWPACAYVLASSPDAEQGTITIEDAAAWLFSIPAQDLPLDPGDWKWDIRFTDSEGNISTYYAGVLTVSANVAPEA